MKTLLISIGAVFLGTIIVGTIWFFFFAPKTSTPTPNNPVTLPLSGTASTTPTEDPAVTQTAVGTSGSGAVVTKNFLAAPTTVADRANPGNYLLTGTQQTGFSIGYRTPAQFFTIALEQEPLGETRTAAENYLLSLLGITKSQLCSLKYYVGTDWHTNSQFAGKNLGFSFCPGATVLPN